MRLLFAALLLLVCSNVLAADKFSLEVKDKEISISGATGDVAWVGVANEASHGQTRMVVRHLLMSPNASGTPRIELPDGVAPRSLWAAVDIVTGEIASATSKLLKLNTKPAADVTDVSGKTPRLRIKGGWIEMLIVRPGIGAWRYSAGDGGAGDDDGVSDGAIVLDPALATPLGTTPPLTALQSKDVVIVLDVPRMSLYTVKR